MDHGSFVRSVPCFPLTLQPPHCATKLDMVPGNPCSWQHYPTHKVSGIGSIKENSPACQGLTSSENLSLLGPTLPDCLVLGPMSRQCDGWFTVVCQRRLSKVSTTDMTCSVCDSPALALCPFSSETQHLHRPRIHWIQQMSTQAQPLL